MVELATPIGVSIVEKMNEGTQLSNGLGPTERDKNVDPKELADRIAAAEAMSCLSSVVLLPSNSEEFIRLSNPNPDLTDLKIENNVPLEKDKNKNGTTKRGKTKAKGAHGPTNRKREKHRTKSKGKTTNVEPKIEQVGNDPVGKINSHVTNLAQNPNVINSTKSIPFPIQMALLSKLKTQQLDLENAKNQTIHNHQIEISSTPSENLILKLPLLLSGGVKTSENVVPVLNPDDRTTDSVEITQSTVDKLISQPLPSKFDSLDSALPLKKRRILAYQESQENMLDDATDGGAESTDGTEKPSQENGGEIPSSGASQPKVNVDPRTSLLLLSEMQMALQQDEDGDLPLHIAVAQENNVMVNKFVHLMSISGKSVDKYNKAQQTPLHLAVELDFVDAVKTLLQAGANPNLVNKRGENSIHLAVKLNYLNCLETIISFSRHKPDLNTRNFEGLAPLHTATVKKLQDIVRILIRAGADVNLQDGKSGRTPLFYAVEHDTRDLIQLFQSCGANIDLPNYAGITAIMAAQARGFQQAATILLKGLDAKALSEHPQREALTCKKIPIPRIPSKSHLIVPGSNRKGEKILNQNSDSNDSQGPSQTTYITIAPGEQQEESMETSDVNVNNETRHTIKMEVEESNHASPDNSVVKRGTEASSNPQVQNIHSKSKTSTTVKNEKEHEKPKLQTLQNAGFDQIDGRQEPMLLNMLSVIKDPQKLTAQQQELLRNYFSHISAYFPQPLSTQAASLRPTDTSAVHTPSTSIVSIPFPVTAAPLYVTPAASLSSPVTAVPSSPFPVATVSSAPSITAVASPTLPTNVLVSTPFPVNSATSTPSTEVTTNSVSKSSSVSQSHSKKRHSDKSNESKSSGVSKNQVPSGSASSSKSGSTTSQSYHLTNISRSTASILAAKLQGTKNVAAVSPLNLTKSIPVSDSESTDKGKNS